jgi:phage-related protein
MGLGSLGAAILSVKILVDASDAAKGMGDAATGVQKFQQKIGGLVGPAALVGGTIVGLGKQAVGAASEAEQAMGGVDTVFGKSADKVKAWGDQAAKSAGLSSTEYATAAAKIGSQLKTAGVPMDQIADKTKEIIQQGADLSATYGGTAADAVDALSSALRGEGDPAEKYGLALSAAAVNAEMAAQGTDKLTGSAATAAKAQATMSLVAKQGAASQGQFAAQSGTAAEQQQIAAAEMANMASTLGQVLLPVVSAASAALGTMAGWVKDNAGAVTALVAVIAALAGGILATSAALKVYKMAQTLVSAATKAWAAVQWLLNAALNANPISLVVIAIVAMVAAIVILWKKSDAFRNFFIGVWRAVTAAAAAAWSAILAAGRAAAAFLAGVWRGIQAVAGTVWSAVSGLVRSAMAVVTAVVRAVAAPISAVWQGIRTAASTVWSAVTAAVRAATTLVLTIVRGLTAPVRAVWADVTAGATAAWDKVKAIVTGVIDAVKAAWETVVGVVQSVWSSVTGIITAALAPIKGAIGGIASVWESTVGAISSGIDKVKGWFGGLISKAGDVAGKVAGALPGGRAAAAPGTGYPGTVGATSSPGLSARALGSAGASSAAGATFNIYGAVDPDGTARQIKGILTGRDRRTSGVRIGGLATA